MVVLIDKDNNLRLVGPVRADQVGAGYIVGNIRLGSRYVVYIDLVLGILDMLPELWLKGR